MSVSIELGEQGPLGQRLVAVKRAVTSAMVEGLEHEARALSAARGPGVVELIDFEQSAAQATLRTGFAGHHTLATVGSLPMSTMSGLLAELTATLARLHRLGVVHGNVRSSHVILGPDNDIKLCGFRHAALTSDVDPADDASPRWAERTAPRPSDDVAAVGHLILELVEASAGTSTASADKSAAGWGLRPHLTAAGPGQRQLLLSAAGQATAADIRVRPTMSVLARSIGAIPPCHQPPITPRARPSTRPNQKHIQTATTGSSANDEHSPPVAPHPSGLTQSPRLPSGSRAANRHARRRQRRRRTIGRLIWGAAALTSVMFAAVLITSLRHPDDRRSAIAASTSTTVGLARSASDSSSTTAATDPPPCSQPGGVASADLDGDGCPEAIETDDRTLVVGRTSFAIGQPGDRVAVGDWDCDGGATAALLRPSTGEVFVFTSWPTPESSTSTGPPLSARARAVVRTGNRVVASDPDGDGCADLVIERTDGLRVEVPT